MRRPLWNRPELSVKWDTVDKVRSPLTKFKADQVRAKGKAK